MVPWKKNITIPSLWKNDHRRSLKANNTKNTTQITQSRRINRISKHSLSSFLCRKYHLFHKHLFHICFLMHRQKQSVQGRGLVLKSGGFGQLWRKPWVQLCPLDTVQLKRSSGQVTTSLLQFGSCITFLYSTDNWLANISTYRTNYCKWFPLTRGGHMIAGQHVIGGPASWCSQCRTGPKHLGWYAAPPPSAVLWVSYCTNISGFITFMSISESKSE